MPADPALDAALAGLGVADHHNLEPQWDHHPADHNYLITAAERLRALVLANESERIHLARYNPVGNGTSDDSQAILQAIADTPYGGVLVLPAEAHLRHTQQLVIEKPMSIVTEGGIAAAFKPDVGTAVDAIHVRPPSGSTYLYEVHLDIAVFGPANACRTAIKVTNTLHSSGRIVVRCGTAANGWGIDFDGIELCDFLAIVNGGNVTGYPYTGAAPANGCSLTPGNLNWPSNANWVKVLIEALAGDGFVMDESAAGSTSGNNWVSGTVQGIIGKGVWCKNCTDFSLRDLHIEATPNNTAATDNKLLLESCRRATIGPGVLNVAKLELVGCEDIELDGVYTDALTIDSTSRRVKLGRVTYGSMGGGFADSAPDTISDGRVVSVAQISQSPALPSSTDVENLLANGDLQGWRGAAPLGNIVMGAGTVARSGDGVADTRKFTGKSAAKISGANADFRAELRPDRFAEVKGRWVTVWAWVYIPSGQGTQPSLTLHTLGNTINFTSPPTTRTDVWHRLALTSLVPDAEAYVQLRLLNGAVGGDWYVGKIGATPGRHAPRLGIPAAPRRAVGEGTWDPPSIASGARTSTVVLAWGAVVGDVVAVGFSNAVPAGALLVGAVTLPDEITVTLLNMTGAALDLASGTVRAESWGV